MDRKSEFVERFLSRVVEQPWDADVKQTPSEIAAGLRERAWFVSAELADGPVALGASKVGGQPDLPVAMTWPCEEDSDAPLAFLAQVRLADAAPADLEGRLPREGMLWLFCIADADRAAGYEIDSTTSHAFYLRDPGALTSRPVPEELREDVDATIEEHGLVFGPCMAFSGLYDVDIVRPVEAALRSVGGRRGPLHLLSPASPPAGWDEDEDVEDAEEDGQEYDDRPRLALLELDGYRIARHAFGAGSIEVQVPIVSLEKGDLTELEVVFLPGT